ncbi:MAG: L,D-transpeptidase family protein [Pseudomonadota bacterium]|nr:L,D-transpeptidase family protein [Pseudomonadota bacterium]
MGLSLLALLPTAVQAQQARPNLFDLLFGAEQRGPNGPQSRSLFGSQPDGQTLYGHQNLTPGMEKFDPEYQVPGLGMGTVDYIPPVTVVVFDPSFTTLKADNPEAESIRALLADKANPLRAQDAERKAVLAFYKAVGFKPMWTDSGQPSAKAQAFMKVIANSGADGMQPKNYTPEVLKGFDNIDAAVGGDAVRLARLDVGLTIAALHYARQLSAGQFEPNRLSLYNDMHPEPVNGDDALKAISAANADDLAAYFDSLSPNLPQYDQLKQALAVLNKGGAVPFTAIPAGAAVKPGKADPRIPALRERLEQLGFIKTQEVPPADIHTLDQDLDIALMAFQTAIKLKPTGILDKPTLKILINYEAAGKREKIIASMERLRWLPRNMGERYVFVNQAAYDVHVIDHGKTLWQSRVIVGQPTKQTYAFYDKIQTVVFNPKWGVPASIIVNEYAPKMRKDPGYLDRNGFIVVDQAGNQIDSHSVDWFNIGPAPKFGLQQLAGGENALGELKFLFPNAHDIYMHDTPTKPLFKTAERAYSHGCVRVQNPREFAEVLLGWNKQQVADDIELNRDTHAIPLPQKVPVYLTYFTAWTNDAGELTFMNDVYGRDAAITKALAYDVNTRKLTQPAVAQGGVSGGIIQK